MRYYISRKHCMCSSGIRSFAGIASFDEEVPGRLDCARMSVLTIRNGGAWNRAKPARLFFWLAVVIVCVSADPAHGAKLSDDGRPVFHPADHARPLGRTGARHWAARAPRARATGEDTACSSAHRFHGFDVEAQSLERFHHEGSAGKLVLDGGVAAQGTPVRL